MKEYQYIKDAFTKEENKTNLEVNNLKAECITSKNSNFELDSAGNLTVKSIKALEDINIELKSIANIIYPVGSIYLSLNNTHPSVLFGGSWEAIAEGRTLIGVNLNDSDYNESNKTGGAKTQSLRALIGATNSNPSRIGYRAGDKVEGYNYNYAIDGTNLTSGIPSNSVNHSTAVVQKNGQAATTIQPYLTCYIWSRIA